MLAAYQLSLLLNRKALVSHRLKSSGRGPPIEAGVEVLSYLKYSELDKSPRIFPGLRVRVLQKPDNWPTRPESGFSNNSEGFD